MLRNLRGKLLTGKELVGSNDQRLCLVVQLVAHHTGCLRQSGTLRFVFRKVGVKSFCQLSLVFGCLGA